MKLYEALRASKTREAEGRLPIDHPRWRQYGLKFANIPVAVANDGGVELITFDDAGNFGEHFQVHWSQILPKDMEYVQSLDWWPRSPKSPLKQLADTLTDFTEMEENEEEVE